MPQTIEVPGMGKVEFPDGMTREEMEYAIHRNSPTQTGPSTSRILELERALIAADAAGNTADAKVFADEIRRVRSESTATGAFGGPLTGGAAPGYKPPSWQETYGPILFGVVAVVIVGAVAYNKIWKCEARREEAKFYLGLIGKTILVVAGLYLAWKLLNWLPATDPNEWYENRRG